MPPINEIFTQENITVFFGAWAGLLALAQVIVRFTPTDADDKLLGKVGSFFEKARNVLTVQKPSASTKDQQ